MSLGTKLQSVHNRVNTKLGTQDATIVFRKTTNTPAAEFGLSYSASSNSDVTITAGIKVGRVKSFETDGGGTIQVGDLKLLVPGSLVTETQLNGAKVLYSSQTYSIIHREPVEIYSGVVVNWLVIARLEQ